MTTVAQAEKIILTETRDYGTEQIPFELALGKVLAGDIYADRDLPPCNRVSMDGIAVDFNAFEKGRRSFRLKGTIAAGDVPIEIASEDECVEIMTGAALPVSTDTVIRYEDTTIQDGIVQVNTDKIIQGQNIHRKGKDKRQGDLVVAANQVIDPTLISMAASVGRSTLTVKRLPKVVVVSTGDELVEVTEQPSAYQVRHSNKYTVRAVLEKQYSLQPDMLHIPDDPDLTDEKIRYCIEHYDVILLSGGISMGKFDYVPGVLESLNVTKLFHKVQQRPGKPFWFGTHPGGTVVFAFPGNPVSTFMCMYRYFLPWLKNSLGDRSRNQKVYAALDREVTFNVPLQYFMQVKLSITGQGHLLATPVEGNGSGDFANLLDSDAFMELPLEQSNFMKGEVYRIWPFKNIL